MRNLTVIAKARTIRTLPSPYPRNHNPAVRKFKFKPIKAGNNSGARLKLLDRNQAAPRKRIPTNRPKHLRAISVVPNIVVYVRTIAGNRIGNAV
jgi:hypothetical protein